MNSDGTQVGRIFQLFSPRIRVRLFFFLHFDVTNDSSGLASPVSPWRPIALQDRNKFSYSRRERKKLKIADGFLHSSH